MYSMSTSAVLIISLPTAMQIYISVLKPLRFEILVSTVYITTSLPAFISTRCSFFSPRASLWSSCVVLPLLALTWMSAVLAITDKRSILFQILFAVFDSLQGFVIVMVHCILRREVEDDFISSPSSPVISFNRLYVSRLCSCKCY